MPSPTQAAVSAFLILRRDFWWWADLGSAPPPAPEYDLRGPRYRCLTDDEDEKIGWSVKRKGLQHG